MDGKHSDEQVDSSWKTKTLIIGGLLGALTGLGAAYLLARQAEKSGTTLSITPGKGVQLGVVLAGLLKSITSLGEEK